MSNDKDAVLAGYAGLSYEQSVHHQVTNWANGVPTHNPVGDECCPDFSCCNPDNLMPESGRKKFLEAHLTGNYELRHEMLMMCLGGLLADSGDKVHIVGSDTGQTQQ